MYSCYILNKKLNKILQEPDWPFGFKSWILKITLFCLLSFVFISCTTPCHSLSLIVISYHSLSFVVTCCLSLSFIVTRFITRCHSLPLVATRSLSLSLVVPLVDICCTNRCHSLSLVVIHCTIRCHLLSLVVTRCTTRLSLYERSCSREMLPVPRKKRLKRFKSLSVAMCNGFGNRGNKSNVLWNLKF